MKKTTESSERPVESYKKPAESTKQPSESPKKISKSFLRILPVSQKAYEGFRERIIRVNKLFGLNPKYMLWLLDEYMYGRTHIKSGGGFVCDVTFKMLCYDIDRAKARSARARENARVRRERKASERREKEQQEQASLKNTKTENVERDNVEYNPRSEVNIGCTGRTEGVNRQFNPVKQRCYSKSRPWSDPESS